MDFGVFFTMDHYESMDVSPAQQLQNVIEQVQAAEQLGFQYAWFTEQHFSAADGLCADPISLLAYVAAKTTRIRLGTAVVVPGLHHAARLAESFALLDVLSGGRIDVGVGASSVKLPFDVYGVPFEFRRELRDRAIETMRVFWGAAPQSASVSALTTDTRDIELALRPLQVPHPPIWVSVGARDRLAPVLSAGYSLLFDYVYSDFDARDAAMIKREVARREVIPPGNVGAVIYTQLADVDSAFAGFTRFFEAFLRKMRGPSFNVRDAWDDLQQRGHILCCDTAEAAQRVAQIADQGLDQLIFGVGFGGASHRTVMRTLEAIAAEVTPALLG